MNKYFLAIIAFTYTTQSLNLNNLKYEEEAEIEDIEEEESELDEEATQETEPPYESSKIKELNESQIELHNKLKNLEESIQDKPKPNNSFSSSLMTFLALMAAYHFYLKDSSYLKNATLEKAQKMMDEKDLKESGYDKRVEELERQLQSMVESISQTSILQSTINQLQNEVLELRKEVILSDSNSKQNSLSAKMQDSKLQNIEQQINAIQRQLTQPRTSENPNKSPISSNASPRETAQPPRSPEKGAFSYQPTRPINSTNPTTMYPSL